MKPLLLALLLFSCAGSSQIRSIVQLPPPESVVATSQENSVRVQWQSPKGEGHENIAGYAVFAARRSLMYASIEQLPVPLVRHSADFNQTMIPRDSLSGCYFLHVRSFDAAGDWSLPSLPELKIGCPR